MPRREPVTKERIERFLGELGRQYRSSGRLYLVGGTQMVHAGFRQQTEDIDYMVQLEDEREDFITTVRSLIRSMNLSVEPVGPGDFIPLPQGWEERSHFVGRYGRLDVFTFDPISTALSKIERGASRDVDDVLALLRHKVITLGELRSGLEDILPRLDTESLRVDETDFRYKFEEFAKLAEWERNDATNTNRSWPGLGCAGYS